MKAYLIDPKEKTITEVNYGGDWRTISQHCDCNTLDMVRLNDQHDSVYVDDEGLLNGAAERDGVFMLTFASPVGEPRRVPIAGKGLVLGHDLMGDSADCRMSLADLQAMVTFPNDQLIARTLMRASAENNSPEGVDKAPN